MIVVVLAKQYRRKCTASNDDAANEPERASVMIIVIGSFFGLGRWWGRFRSRRLLRTRLLFFADPRSEPK